MDPGENEFDTPVLESALFSAVGPSLVLTLDGASESPGGLVKTQMLPTL